MKSNIENKRSEGFLISYPNILNITFINLFMGKHLRSKKVVIHKNTEDSIIYILLLDTVKEIEVGVRAVLRSNL